MNSRALALLLVLFLSACATQPPASTCSPQRDTLGRIARSQTAISELKRLNPCPTSGARARGYVQGTWSTTLYPSAIAAQTNPATCNGRRSLMQRRRIGGNFRSAVRPRRSADAISAATALPSKRQYAFPSSTNLPARTTLTTSAALMRFGLVGCNITQILGSRPQGLRLWSPTWRPGPRFFQAIQQSAGQRTRLQTARSCSPGRAS